MMRRDLQNTRLVRREGRFVLVNPANQIMWRSNARSRFGAERNDPGIVADFGVNLVKFALLGLGMYGLFFKVVPAVERVATRSKQPPA